MFGRTRVPKTRATPDLTQRDSRGAVLSPGCPGSSLRPRELRGKGGLHLEPLGQGQRFQQVPRCHTVPSPPSVRGQQQTGDESPPSHSPAAPSPPEAPPSLEPHQWSPTRVTSSPRDVPHFWRHFSGFIEWGSGGMMLNSPQCTGQPLPDHRESLATNATITTVGRPDALGRPSGSCSQAPQGVDQGHGHRLQLGNQSMEGTQPRPHPLLWGSP